MLLNFFCVFFTSLVLLCALAKICAFLMVMSIFMDNYYYGYDNPEVRSQLPFDFYYYYIFYVVTILTATFKFGPFKLLPRWFFGVILTIFGVSMVAGSMYGTLKFGMYKQMIGISFSSMAFYCAFKLVNFDFKLLFKWYLWGALYVSYYGIFEEIATLAGYWFWFGHYKPVSIGLYRVYSLMGEPYFLAVALTPALHYYANCLFGPQNFKKPKVLQFSVVLLCMIFTFSTAGYACIGMVAVMVLINRGLLKIVAIVGIILAPSLSIQKIGIQEMQVRMQDVVTAFSKRESLTQDEILKLNSSSFALISNFLVAQKSFMRNPAIGSGIGSHEYSYEEFAEQLLGPKFKIIFGEFNVKDANSLFIRLMSELGIFGISIFIYFCIRYFLFRRGLKLQTTINNTIINQGCFILFVIRLIRTGNYLGQGFFFFFFFFYYSYKEVNAAVKAEKLKLT